MLRTEAPSIQPASQPKPDLNLVKGIGIILVIIGHTTTGLLKHWIFLFHIPLFFYLFGIFFDEALPLKKFLKRRIETLIIPYLTYLLIFNIPVIFRAFQEVFNNTFVTNLDSYLHHLYIQAYGGELLVDDFASFWFVTCIFFVQIAYFYLNKRPVYQQHLFVALGYFLALIEDLFFPEFSLPLSFNVFPVALLFFHLGYHFREKGLAKQRTRFIIGMTTVILSFILVLGQGQYFDASFNIKAANYGIPILSILVAWLFCAYSLILARLITPIFHLKSTVATVGSASFTILFTHQAIKHHLLWNNGITQPLITSVIITILCLGIFKIQQTFPLTKYLFFGIKPQLTKQKE